MITLNEWWSINDDINCRIIGWSINYDTKWTMINQSIMVLTEWWSINDDGTNQMMLNYDFRCTQQNDT